LESIFGKNPSVKLNKVGLGSQVGNLDLHVYNDDLHTGHGSIYPEVFSDLHNTVETQKISIAINTIDDYCSENEVSTIDFIKIDVEGNELEVLKGAVDTIPRISVIQFEFNEMNVVSRVFMRDFYEVLQGFDFCRINVNGLIPLGKYSSNHEIFSIQNIVAVNRNID